jgi:hypothetical protein
MKSLYITRIAGHVGSHLARCFQVEGYRDTAMYFPDAVR